MVGIPVEPLHLVANRRCLVSLHLCDHGMLLDWLVSCDLIIDSCLEVSHLLKIEVECVS